MREKYDLANIPKELFEFAPKDEKFHDRKFDTKPIGYFKDAFLRFSKNKASIVAAIIVGIIIIFALIGPYCFNQSYVKSYQTNLDLKKYRLLTPKLMLFEGTGFWDGTEVKIIGDTTYKKYLAYAQETGYDIIVKVIDEIEVNTENGVQKNYKVRLNNYHSIDAFTKTYTEEQYKAIQEWQNENNVQLIMPWVVYYNAKSEVPETLNSKVKFNNINVWYECDSTGIPTLDENGNLIPGYRVRGVDHYNSLRLDGDPGKDDPEAENRWRYALVSGSKKNGYNYTVRINAYNYFEYAYGFEPAFAFGSDGEGYDIFTRLASGARFSLLFAIAVSSINLLLGVIYGSIEGYYGGAVDMIMERISDILSAIPGMVVTVLFNLHLSGTLGTVVSLLFAFILTGWIGTASRTRMQFYRFKNQEYVLAARTLGAGDRRIMFKHIFPNSLGTLITGSVLVIPGVIFGETSLTYLGIINLDSPTRSSVGSMLANGQGIMNTSPHLVLFPAIFIGLLMVSFNLFGNGLRDAFNPSLRGAED